MSSSENSNSVENSASIEKQKTHLKWVEKLPDDVIEIKEFNNYNFDNFYYSPSTNEFYQSPKQKFRILYKDDKIVRCRSQKSSATRLNLDKFMKEFNPK